MILFIAVSGVLIHFFNANAAPTGEKMTLQSSL